MASNTLTNGIKQQDTRASSDGPAQRAYDNATTIDAIVGDVNTLTGGSPTLSGTNNVIVGGSTNTNTTGSENAIVGGSSHTMNSGSTTDSVIIGGANHTISSTGDRCVILGGDTCRITNSNNSDSLIGSSSFTDATTSKVTALSCTGYGASEEITVSGIGAIAASVRQGYSASVAVSGQLSCLMSAYTYYAGNFAISGLASAGLALKAGYGATTNLSGSYSAIIASYAGSLTSGANSLMAAARNSTITGSYQAVVGGENNAITTGFRNVIIGGTTNEIKTGATQNSVIVGGSLNDITSTDDRNVIVGGTANGITSGQNIVILGGSDAKGTINDELVRASGQFSTQGDAQAMHLLCRRQVNHVSAAWTSLYPNTETGEHLAIPTDTIWTFEALITGATSGLGKTFGFKIQGCIENDGGTTALKGTPTVTAIDDSDDTDFDAQAAADNTNNALLIQVRDSTSGGDTVRWFAQVTVSAITYA